VNSLYRTVLHGVPHCTTLAVPHPVRVADLHSDFDLASLELCVPHASPQE
jgi:hypothetical protein